MYFRELETPYINRWRVSLVRAILLIAAGILLLFVPGITTVAVLWLFGAALIIDAVIITLPLLLGRTTTHVWKIVVARAVVQIVVGVLLFTNLQAGFNLLRLGLVLLLFFRAIIELILFVELPASSRNRRWMLLLTILFLALSIRGFIALFADGLPNIHLIAFYLIFEGVSHLLAAFRSRQYYQQVETYERALLDDESAADAGARQTVGKPQPPPDRAFLLPHIETAKYRKILVFSPHPDDLEAFMGGLVYRLSGEVVSIIFSRGDEVIERICSFVAGNRFADDVCYGNVIGMRIRGCVLQELE